MKENIDENMNIGPTRRMTTAMIIENPIRTFYHCGIFSPRGLSKYDMFRDLALNNSA
jgi:hypothetical protein